MPRPPSSRPDPRNGAAGRSQTGFSEAEMWAGVKDGAWQHLHGSFREEGYSIEWHDFSSEDVVDWSRSFHSGGVEICLNLSGHGLVRAAGRSLELSPLTAGFYFQDTPALIAERTAGKRHQFITVELSLDFLKRHLQAEESGLYPWLAEVLKGNRAPQVSETIRLTTEHQQMVMSLRQPPVYVGAQRLWYQAKALEVASAMFFRAAAGQDLFCQRQKRVNQERVQKVITLLKENLAEAPPLEEIGRRVGCSHFYLSRVFSQETGKSIFQHLRQLRMERAAELLREGRLNVTQVSLEVGYASPSHFSMAFHEAFGCCPGLYPLPGTPRR